MAAAGRRSCAVAALEISGVPAAAFQLEAGGGNFFDQAGLATLGAFSLGGVGDLLQNFRVLSTSLAMVFVKGHLDLSYELCMIA
jgi:hypothetical protein